MKLREISVTVSRTFNLGNFESLRIEAGAVADLTVGEAPDEARPKLIDEVRASLRAQYEAFKPRAQS